MPYKAPVETSVGHIHLRVSDLERSIAFYRDALGFELMLRYGDQAAFLSAGGYHHHIGLNTWESLGGDPAPKDHAGMYHVAFLYPDRASLGAAIAHALDNGVTLTGAADHLVSEAVYFDDPDGNGIELYRDRPRSDWPTEADGTLRMANARLDVAALIAEGRAALDD